MSTNRVAYRRDGSTNILVHRDKNEEGRKYTSGNDNDQAYKDGPAEATPSKKKTTRLAQLAKCIQLAQRKPRITRESVDSKNNGADARPKVQGKQQKSRNKLAVPGGVHGHHRRGISDGSLQQIQAQSNSMNVYINPQEESNTMIDPYNSLPAVKGKLYRDDKEHLNTNPDNDSTASNGVLKKPLNLPQSSDKVFKFFEEYHAYCLYLDEKNNNSTAATQVKKKRLLKTEDSQYLTYYGQSCFADMVQNEHKHCFKDMYERQNEISLVLRAQFIDWLWSVYDQLQIRDKTVFFQAVYLMDSLYNDPCIRSKPAKDLQLTGVTCLFIASKNLEVDPIDMHTCKNVLLFRKYTREQIVEKEKEIRLASQYQNEVPSIFDFLIFFHKYVKLQVQNQFNCTVDTQNFLNDVLQTAYDFTKAMMIDETVYQYRPSVMAAVALLLGFQQNFYYCLMQDFHMQTLSMDISNHQQIIKQASQTFACWEQTFNTLMPNDNFQQIQLFSKKILMQTVRKYKDSGSKHQNIYSERCQKTFKEPVVTSLKLGSTAATGFQTKQALTSKQQQISQYSKAAYSSM